MSCQNQRGRNTLIASSFADAKGMREHWRSSALAISHHLSTYRHIRADGISRQLCVPFDLQKALRDGILGAHANESTATWDEETYLATIGGGSGISCVSVTRHIF